MIANSQPLFVEGDLAVRTFADDDAALLSSWLSDPAVSEFYGGRDRDWSEPRVRQYWLDPARSWITQCVVEQHDEPIGYVQFYPLEPATQMKYGYVPAAASVWGIDVFIGLPGLWNQGIGTRLVRSTVQYIVDRYQPLAVTIDPRTGNPRGIRCYEKAGFRRVRVVPRHEFFEGAWEDCLLMVVGEVPNKGALL